MKIAIIDYGTKNAKEVSQVLKGMGFDPLVTDNAEEISAADKVILPGGGRADDGMKALKEKKLDELILSLNQPVLGICLGMHLMCRQSEEGNAECLGIFRVNVKKLISPSPEITVPEIGWNTISKLKGPLFKDVPDNAAVYYMHGYYAELDAYTSAVTNYIQPYSAALSYENFHAVQFHPETSGVAGEFVLRNFLNL